jgi:ubiquinone biosynthesis protein
MSYLRLFKIAHLCARYRVDQILPESRVRHVLRRATLFFPVTWGRKQTESPAVRLRLALEALGPIFVKFGQTLSTRADLLPVEFITELSKLQDQVPAFSGHLVEQEILQAYGRSIATVFKTFSMIPLASASVAQVHAATLPDGSDVIVKIIRPDLEKEITVDIKLLYFLARFAMRRWRDAKRLRLTEVVQEFEKIIFQELDMLREAANAEHLRRNFEDSKLLYVPKVHLAYCRSKVLVMERIYGVRISDLETLRNRKVDFKKLAERGVEIFYTQVFRDKFFHADMHPGNIFVDATDPNDPRYLGIDFGIMGTLSDNDQYYLAQNFLAFFNRDYYRVAKLHIDSGWVPRETRVDELETAIRIVCEPIFNKPMSEISFAIILLRLFDIARQFNMEVQPQLALLQKTLLNVEGLGRQLYPDLNLWETAKPFLESMMKKQLGLRSFFKTLRANLPSYLKILPQLPMLLAERVEQQREHGQLLLILEKELKANRAIQKKMLWVMGGLVLMLVLVLVHVFK